MSVESICERPNALHAGIASTLIALRSMLRGLSLFVSERPKTPLRVLCIMAFDALYTLRTARPLPWSQRRILAALLDFGACANAAFDEKHCGRRECRQTLQLLEEAG